MVSSSTLYGGTYNQFALTLKRFGMPVHFVDASDPESFRRAITPRTKLLYGETIGNPKADIFDIGCSGLRNPRRHQPFSRSVLHYM